MTYRIKFILKNLIYIIIVFMLIISYKMHYKKTITENHSINFFNIKIAKKNYDNTTLKNLARNTIKKQNNNIYYNISCIILYKINKNKNNYTKATQFIEKIKIKKKSYKKLKEKKNKLNLEKKIKNKILIT